MRPIFLNSDLMSQFNTVLSIHVASFCSIVIADSVISTWYFSKQIKPINNTIEIAFMLWHVNQKHSRVAIDWQLFAVDCFDLGNLLLC